MQYKTDELHLVTLLERERDSARKRESVLISVIIHLLFIMLVIVNPKFLSIFESKPKPPEPEKEVTELITPPSLREMRPVLPPPPVRGHIQPPPPTTPNPGGGMEAPAIKRPETPPAVAQQKSTQAPAPAQQQKGGIQAEPQQQAKLNVPQGPKLEDLSPEDKNGRKNSKLNLGEFTGNSLDEAIRQAAKNRGSGGMGAGEGLKGPQSGARSNLSIDEPLILSDTYGVDLDPYLRRIYFIVRANWYSLIPELIYTGRKGRVTIVFDISKKGNILNMNVVARSGTTPYDNAAVGSLNLSSPLPSLPNYFPGDHVTLQYTFLYNLAPRS